ncbi:MAG: hypothetical protein WCI05_17565 [Myxococcales bacterium]|jgi:hypothetical protein
MRRTRDDDGPPRHGVWTVIESYEDDTPFPSHVLNERSELVANPAQIPEGDLTRPPQGAYEKRDTLA